MPLKLEKRAKSKNFYIVGTKFGQEVRVSAGTSDRKEAEQILALYEGLAFETHKRSLLGLPQDVSLKDAAIDYIEAKDPHPNTLAHIERITNHFGDVMLSNITQKDLEVAYRAILRPGAAEATKCRNVFTPLLSIMKHAGHNPGFTRPKGDAPRTRYLKSYECAALIEHAGRIRPLVVFLLDTGARMSEALRLSWRDVDLHDRICHFTKTKNGTPRENVVLSNRVIEELLALPNRLGPVFLDTEGKPYQNIGVMGGQVRTEWKHMVEGAGLDGVTPHILRHTWATNFYRETKDLLLLCRVGGWKRVDMVQRYAHTDVSEVRETINNLGRRA